MSTRLDIRLPDDLHAKLEKYCKRYGATKTAVFVQLLRVIDDEKLMNQIRNATPTK